MFDEPDDGVSYSTELPEWLERDAKRLRIKRLVEDSVIAGELVLLGAVVVVLLVLIF